MNTTEFSKLNSGEKHLVEWRTSTGGGFFTVLFLAITVADEVNLSKLEKAFPEDVQAFRNYNNVHGWWEDLGRRLEIP